MKEHEEKLKRMTIRRRRSLAIKGHIKVNDIPRMPWHEFQSHGGAYDIQLDPDTSKLFLGTADAKSVMTVDVTYSVCGRQDSVGIVAPVVVPSQELLR